MIPRELLKKIRKIEISTSRLVNSQLAGQYHSVFKGRGIVFSEVRQYYPGDEVRSIDWNVSARMNEPFVKQFVEERDRTVMLLVDMSASQLFGSGGRSKREIAAELAALVAFSAIKNNDRVGLIIFTDQVERFLPPKKGKRHVLRVIREILGFEPASARTSIAVALDYLGRISRRKAVVFLVSDFLAGGWERSLQITAQRHDVVPVVITDPMEIALPPVGIAAFEDLETGEVIEFDASGREARHYAAYVAGVEAARAAALKRMQLDVVNVRTDRPYVDALVAFFRIRARRMQHA
jgi:uncharacterized protein (DUF58 family)